MKRTNFIVVIFIALGLTFITAYGNTTSTKNFEKNNEDPSKTEAFYQIFQDLYGKDTALNHKIKYIAVDISSTENKIPKEFLEKMEEFCASSGFIFLVDSIDGLKEKGYIKDLYFKEGIVISFSDVKVSKYKIKLQAMKWRSGLGAIGAEYTLSKEDGVWKYEVSGGQWIS